MKVILVLLDGAGDRSYEALGWRTPLQAADTPNMDRMAAIGGNGLLHAGKLGECLPSETAHYLLWGYPRESFPGRGLLEAVGYGVPFDDADVLVLAHLAGILWEGRVPCLALSRKAVAQEDIDLETLYRDLDPFELNGIRIELHHTGGNDAILVLKGKCSPFISDSDPMTIGMPLAMVKPLEESPEPELSAVTAEVLNRYIFYCRGKLSNHPINKKRAASELPTADFLVTQRAGRRSPQKPFEMVWGMRGRLIASGAIYAGLASELGMKFDFSRDSKDPGNDLRGRIEAALEDNIHGFIHVHTKAPDEAGHRGDPIGKAKILTELDRGLEPLVKTLEGGGRIIAALTADHSTPCSPPLIHSGEPVPLVIAGPTVRRDMVDHFDELSAANGCLGLLRGNELMLYLLNASDRSSLLGHRLGGGNRAFFPLDYDPLTARSP